MYIGGSNCSAIIFVLTELSAQAQILSLASNFEAHVQKASGGASVGVSVNGVALFGSSVIRIFSIGGTMIGAVGTFRMSSNSSFSSSLTMVTN